MSRMLKLGGRVLVRDYAAGDLAHLRHRPATRIHSSLYCRGRTLSLPLLPFPSRSPPPSPSLQGRQSPVRAHHRVDHHLLPRNVLAGELAGRARRRHRDVRLLQHFGLLPRAPNFLGSLQPGRGKVGRSFDSRGLLHPLEHAGGFEVCRGALESEAHTRGGAKVSPGLPMAPHLQHVRSAFRILTQWEGVNPGSSGENTK